MPRIQYQQRAEPLLSIEEEASQVALDWMTPYPMPVAWVDGRDAGQSALPFDSIAAAATVYLDWLVQHRIPNRKRTLRPPGLALLPLDAIAEAEAVPPMDWL